jgi:hypothetical protein
MGEGWGEACAGVITDWTIPEGDAISASSAYGELRSGRYTVAVSFDDPGRHSARQDFEVE